MEDRKLKYLSPFITSRNLIAEGFGNKTHIYDYNLGRCLCDTKKKGTCTTLSNITMEWIIQADPQKELCQVCKKIAENYV